MLVQSLRLIKSTLRSTGLLPLTKRLAGPGLRWLATGSAAGSVGYRLRTAIERANFSNLEEVHDLPGIFHYWSNRHVLPKCQAFGFSHPDEFFANHLEAALRDGAEPRFISVGSGNCDTEVRLAGLLKARGHTGFVIECLDINADMLKRGLEHAHLAGLSGLIETRQEDFNTWRPKRPYGAVIANQALHHVVELEHLFDAVSQAMGPGGRLITSDIIGRNGHQRWPEALEIVQEYWRELPISQRYNYSLGRSEVEYQDWDCAIAGFEGIRAQDILPLLVERFHFETFLPFANVIDPFIDRPFGRNFDANNETDRAFIDRVHARDEQEIAAGRIKPAHMFAVLRNDPPKNVQQMPGLSPAFCVRKP